MRDDATGAIQPTGGDYDEPLADLRAIISGGRQRAAVAINEALVATYWAIGERIVQAEQQGALRAQYGTHFLSRLGRTLTPEFGRGFAEQSLRNMRQFYLTYPIRSAVRS